MAAYLFTHFTEEKHDREEVWFAVSRDGLHWQDLGEKKSFLKSKTGTKGIRDPFIIFDEKQKKYFIIATDLKTRPHGNWDKYSHNGSKSIIIWESGDLIHWSKERAVRVGTEKAGCVWAPEAVFCPERDEWMVFFASAVDGKQRIFACFTKDFYSFGETFEYITRENETIDTTIVRDNGFYYRFSKDETTKKIFIDRAENILSEHFEPIHSEVLADYFGLEGPEVYFLEDRKQWCLIVDRFHLHEGYLPLVTDNLSTGNFRILDPDEYDLGKRKKRHGGVIAVSDEEYERLIEFFNRK